MLLQTIGKLLPQAPDTPLRIVDAAVVAVAEHHAGIDHGRHVSRHSAPTVALNVDEAQQLRITDVAACHIPSICGQE